MTDTTILTQRQRSVIAFALRRFMDEAHSRAQAAGQDRDGRYFKPGAVTAFLIDAGDAECLLGLMRGGPMLIPPHGDEPALCGNDAETDAEKPKEKPLKSTA